MTYAIGEIIYGIDFTDLSRFDEGTALQGVDRDELEEFRESDYIDGAYSGNGDTPYWFGVQMGNIDECSNERGSEIIRQFTATDKHKADYQAALDRLRDDDEWSQALRDAVIGHSAEVWLLWGSS